MNSITTTFSDSKGTTSYRIFGVCPANDCMIVPRTSNGRTKWTLVFDEPGCRQITDVTYDSAEQAFAAVDKTYGWRQIV